MVSLTIGLTFISSFYNTFFRLRLKKEFDDYKKHPEYNNFVREEGFSSSSSSSSSDEERGLDAKVCSLSDHYRRSEEEDLEVPRCLWKGGKTFKKLFVQFKTVIQYLMVLLMTPFSCLQRAPERWWLNLMVLSTISTLWTEEKRESFSSQDLSPGAASLLLVKTLGYSFNHS